MIYIRSYYNKLEIRWFKAFVLEKTSKILLKRAILPPKNEDINSLNPHLFKKLNDKPPIFVSIFAFILIIIIFNIYLYNIYKK